MTTIREFIRGIAALFILPAIVPVLVVFAIIEYLKNTTSIDEDRAKKLADKVMIYGLVPVCILGVIGIKALGIYMLIGGIVGIPLIYHYCRR